MRAPGITTRATATLTAAGLLLLCAGPAMAADPVAQAEAEAISLSVGGTSVTDQVGGPYSVVRTADGEQATGSNDPQADLITGQESLAAGVLAQDARTGLAGNRGVSEACSGVAGAGASVVGVGGDGRCLQAGRNAEIALTPDGLDLEELLDVELVEGTGSLADILGQLPAPGGSGDDPVESLLGTINDQLQTALAPFANTGLFAEVGAITSQCAAGPGRTASGDAELADVSVFLRLPPDSPVNRVDLLQLRTRYEPNTKLVTQLDDVIGKILDEALGSLKDSEVPDEITTPLEQVRDAVKEQLLAQIAEQGAPLEQNLLDGTLNKQTRAPGEIEVTAIDLDVLPVVEEQAGFVPVELALARSQCGPSAALETPEEPGDPGDPGDGGPDVPRVVPAGVDGAAADDSGPTVPAGPALLALTTVATATGLAVHRRQARARG